MKDPTGFAYEDLDAAEMHRQERVDQGFSRFDMWNFDNYIAWVIANAMTHLRDEGHGLFMYDDFDYTAINDKSKEQHEEAKERTRNDYNVMIDGFTSWVEFSENNHGVTPGEYKENFKVAEDKLNAALDMFKKHFMALWD